ncbi:MAG: hypothetical protein H6601_03275 [Flavobacteriales bacterium]|nr:hypothetical protein [Flavobacteriales bacterium]
MKKQYLSTVLKSLFCAAIIATQAFTASAQSDWYYGCGDGMTVEIEYTGLNNDVPETLSFSNAGNIDHVVAEIVYKGCNPGSSITIQDASNNSYTAYRVQPSGTSSNVWVYRTTIPATASISYSNQYNESCAQSLVAYVFRQEENAGQTAGTFTERSGYNNVVNISLPIPTDLAARDVTLYVPMSEMTTDGRYIHLEASAGGVSASVTERIYSSSLPNGCCIKLFELQLNNVPANTNTVNLTIDTRHNVHESANGQSWVLAAAVYTDIECAEPCTDGTGWLLADHYNETSCGGNRSWENRDNAENSDNSYAKVRNLCLTYPLSKCFDIEHFHPDLNANDIISGIEVSIERKAEHANSVVDEVVQLIMDGNVIGENRAKPGAWSTSEMQITYGGSNDTWGTNLTPDDVDDHEFGIRIQVRGISQEEYDAYIDQVQISFCVSSEPPCGIDCYIPAEGELCFASPDAPEATAQSIWTSVWSTDANTGLMTIRVTLAPTFVDNTYGTNTIGWPADNHTFNHLKGSDHLQLALYDANDVKQLEFKMDYIDTDGSVPSGYSSLGLDGNGGMVEGNSNYIVDITSSLDKNFNEYGYVLTTNSPATDGDYTPNPSYPNWIYEVWYEAVIDLQAFGNVGFGYPEMTSVHASPSKTGNNSEDVEPVPCDDCDGVTIEVTASGTDVSCDSDNSHECEAVHYQNGSHAVWINTLPGTGQYFKFENNSGSLVEYPDGTARITGVIYNTVETDKRWAVDVYLNDKMNWTQWQAAGGSWKGNATTVGNNYQDWAYYEMDASRSRLIGLGYYAGKELNIQRMAAAPQFRVQVGTAANDKNGNYGFSLWFDYSGDYSGHGDFNFDLQNCVDHGCDGTATATASGGTAPYLYVWDNGATTSSLDDLCAGQYCVTVTDANGCTSDEVCVTIGDKPSCCNVTDPGEITGNGSGCAPFDPPAITSVELPSGGSGDIEYVWIYRTSNGNGGWNAWQTISGANGPEYDPGVITETTQFRRCARREGCSSYVGESNILTMTVTGPCCDNITDGGEIAENQSNCGPFDVAELTNVESPSGGSGAMEIVWITRSGTSGPWQEITGAHGLTYDPGVVSTTTQFRRCARREGCTDYVGESNIITITINPGITATCSSNNGTCSNGNLGSASVSATGGTAPYTYVWSNGSTTSSISGLSAGTYSVTVTDANGCSDNSSVTVSITPCCNVTNGGQIAGGGSNCGPFDPAPITSASLPTGGLGDIEYVWMWNTENVPNYGNNGWVAIPNSNSETYDPGLLTETRCFLRCSRRSGCTTYVGESNIVCFIINPEPVATCTPVNGTCSNNNQASASVAVTGGTAPFTYLWSNGATTASINGLAAGTYSVTVTDANGCTDNCSVSVTSTPCCNVTDPGEIAANQNNCGPFDPVEITSVSAPSGGLGALEIVWITRPGTSGPWTEIPGATGLSYDPGVVTQTTQFRRCARRAGCTDYIGESNIITITVYSNDIVANCSSTDVDCNGASTGSASVSVSGGTAPYTVLWSTGATTMSISNLMAGSYSVTVTDANGCTKTCSTTVGQPSDLTANCSKVDGTCSNNNQASASVAASGGTAPYSYSWSNGGTTSSISALSAGSYSVTVTDANGCAESCSVTISITPCCNVTNGGQIAGGGSNCGPFDPAPITSVSLPTGGLGDLEYVWLWNSQNVPNNGNSGWVMIPNSNSATYDPGMLTETRCFLRCARRRGCTTYVGESNIVCFTINPEPVATCTPINGTCSNNNQASASVSVSGGTAPYAYAWSNGATTASISGLSAGTYSVTVTDANGCTDECSTTVSITPCCNVNNGGQIAGGGSNCGPFDPAPITSASLPTSGLGDLEYVWLWNTQNVVNNGNSGWQVIPGANGPTYDPGLLTETRCFLRCARRSGCTTYVGESNIICFTINPEPTASCSKVDGTCANGNQASASVSVSGGTAPYSYAWSNGATTASISNLANGTYSVTVTDANGCSDDCSVTVTTVPCCNVTDPGTVAGSQSNCGPFDPVAFTSVAPATGGLGDIVYQWYSKETETAWMPILGANGETYDPGMISVNTQFKRCAKRATCPEFEQCSNVLEITIYPDNIIATCSSAPVGCNGASSGSVSVAVQGGTSPYTYLWSNGATTSSVNGLAAGSYSVTVTDVNGCTKTCQTTVSQPNALSVDCSKVDGTCANNNQASVSVSASGGTAPYTYLWSNGATTASINGLAAGTYSVTVTDANGCIASCSKTVSITPCCNVTNGGQIAGGVSNCGPFDPAPITSASLPTGGLGDLEYVWLWNTQNVVNNGNSGWVEIPNSNSATYDPGMLTETRCFLRCARRSGCTTYVGESNIVCFTINPEPVATCTPTNGTCSNNNQASASVAVTGGTAPYTYLWSNGATTASINGLGAGTYSVTVTDANGCTDECSTTVSITPCCNVTNGGQIAGRSRRTVVVHSIQLR